MNKNNLRVLTEHQKRVNAGLSEIAKMPVDTSTATKRMNYFCITAHGRVN